MILKNAYIRISTNFRFSSVVVRVRNFSSMLCVLHSVWHDIFFDVPSLNFQKFKEGHAPLNIIHKPFKKNYKLSLQHTRT